ncbi:MAG: DEAD/DEAH box helicase, partial [Chloroflexi bacterium]
MTYTVNVTNINPKTTKLVPSSLLKLFQQYFDNQDIYPFEHQAEVFKLVGKQNKEVMLVAGTAAGKTLAIGVPLFEKLRQGEIRKVLLMYPTIALMNDQRRVMDELA